MAGQSIPPEALAAVLNAAHGAGAKSAAAPAPDGGGGGAPPGPGGDPSQMPPGGGDPTQQDPTQDPNAQGQDPNSQAVWQEFPATDPQNVQSLAQQMQQEQDPGQLVQLLGQFLQQADADNEKLSQMHEAMLSQLMDLLQGPGGAQPAGGQAQAGPAPVGAQGPGVGGNGTGY